MGIETKLLAKITDPEAMARAWERGLRFEAFEDPIHRFAYQFMIDYWLDDQMRNPPTRLVMESEYPQLALEEDVPETIDWLVDWLQRRYSARTVQEVVREAMKAAADDPVTALESLWQSAYGAAQSNIARNTRIDVTETVAVRRERYARDVENRSLAGVRIGLDELDEHTRGILPGELCAVAAFTKTGKSFLLAKTFVTALQSGLRPIFFTLEMGIPEMEDRMDAIYSGVSYQRLSQRDLTFEDSAALRAAQDEMALGERGFIERPERGERTVKHMISRARQCGAGIVLIDQLSFIDAERSYSGDSALRMKHGDIVFELKDEISRENAQKIPCMLAVQLNRQVANSGGGRGALHNFSNSSMVEQTVDLALGLWRNTEMRANNAMGLDIMGSRRCDTRSWTMAWHLTERTELRIREEFFEGGGGSD